MQAQEPDLLRIGVGHRREIAGLKAARDSLLRLARACDAGAIGPCPIIAAFDRG